MRMLWVTMGMYVPFVAPSLTLRRCPCVTSGDTRVSMAKAGPSNQMGLLLGWIQN